MLLGPGATPEAGRSVVIFTADFGGGGRVKLDDSDSCQITFANPCHFSVPDGQSRILVDMPLEYGDTTAFLTTSGERVYVIESVPSGARSAARAFGGLPGALLTQPDSAVPQADSTAQSSEAAALTSMRGGSRFDLELTSVGARGAAANFVTPKETIVSYPLR